MGCCLSRENKDGSPLKYNTIHGDENGLDTRGLLFKVSNQNPQTTTVMSEPNDSVLNRSNYNKPNLAPICINDEQNISDAPLKLKKEDVLEINIIINSFDFMCNAVNFFNYFSCDFNPELLVTFEEKIENFTYEKNVEIDVDEDYLNKSGQFEAGLLGMSKKKSMSNLSSVNNTTGERTNSNRPPTPTSRNNPNGEKKIKQYYFDSNLFRIPEITYNKLISIEKNSFINFSIFQKNKRDQSIKFLVGEGYIPVNFLYSAFKEEILEIPIYNHIEDIFLGNLSVKIITKFTSGDSSSDIKEKLETLQATKTQNLASLNDFLKFQFLNLHYYGKILRKAFNHENEIPSIYDYNLFKIQLHNIIQKFIKSNNEKEEALKELYEFFYEYVDTGNTSFNLETENLRKSSTITMTTTSEGKKKYRLDFKTLNQTKYFIFVCILNEILIKCDNSDSNFTLLKSSKFLNEKIIFSAYESSKNENKNYLLAENVVSLLLNIRKNSSNPFDPRYRIDYLLAYFGTYYKKSAAHYLTFLEKSGIRMSTFAKQKEVPLKTFGPVSNESFIVFRNLIYKFLKLVKFTLDNKNETLEQKDLKESNPAKYEELVDLASQDVEAMKRNYFYFLSTKDVILKKDKTPLEKEFLYINDLNYVIGILNIFYSYIKLAKNLAKNHLRILPVEFYISQLLSDNSEFVNFVSVTLNIFYKNTKYLNLILDIMYELFSEAYGIFIFNFFKKVDVNLLFKAFSVDAKYIDSRKFNSWNSLFIIFSKCCKLIKKPESESLDFISLKWEPIYTQILSLNTILQKNHYFKIPDEIDLEFDPKNNYIFLKNQKIKYMTNKLSVKIQNKFFEIFHDFSNRPELISKTISKNDKTFTKILMRIVFLTLLKIDGNLVDIVKQSTEYFFKTYINILYILSNLKKSLNFDLSNEVSYCLSNIFPSTSSTVIENYEINKFVDILGNKIKSMAPSKFDHKATKFILENLNK
jgi:hypothetical protein